MEELPHIDKVVGRGKEPATEVLLETFKESGNLLQDIELEKTSREIEIISFCTKAVDECLSKYGRLKNLDIPIQNIHIVKEGGVESLKDGNKEAVHYTPRQMIAVDRRKSEVEMALRIFHELFHAKSFTSVHTIENDDEFLVEGCRSGFSINSVGGESRYFVSLMEAVVQLMTMNFYREKVLTNELFKDEVENIKVGHEVPDLGYSGDLVKMNSLIDDLWEKNQDMYKNKEEILNLFIDAQINGRLLKLGRLIESTYGVGAFRQLGKGADLP